MVASFERLLALVFVFAYLSLYLQFEGLYSVNGLLPIADFVEMVLSGDGRQERAAWDVFISDYPSLFVFAKTSHWNLPVETVAEWLMLVGLASSAWLVVSGERGIRAALPSLAMVACYLSMYLAGQTFLSFQWDLLLLESGWVLAVSNVVSVSVNSDSSGSWTPTWNWCYRLILFKLMLMSGVVKLTAGCDTWNSLTALSYHFATQCLPTPLAWIAHGLPGELLRVSVAATLVIEIPLTLLLIVPHYRVRRVGVVLQVVLQVSIILTGNYNFFNLLTMLLCMKCWEKDEVLDRAIANVGGVAGISVETHGPPLALAMWVFTACKRVQDSAVGTILVDSLTVGFIANSLVVMFVWNDHTGTLDLRPHLMADWQPVVGKVSNAACALCMGMGVLHSLAALACALESSPKGMLFIVYRNVITLPIMVLSAFLQLLWMGLVATPLAQIGSFSIANWLGGPSRATRLYSFASGYGLFRRMTGVGQDGRVARPEIVLEGLSARDGLWHEIDFQHKPTALDARPSVVVPHQPRLDWQMWFAALGSYHHNAWLVHLVYKLLKGEGSQAVVPLLNQDSYLTHFHEKEPPLAIKATLYEYDFTTFAQEMDTGIDKAWWRRSHPQQWLPELRLTDSSLVDFLSSKGFQPSLSRMYLDAEARRLACVAAVGGSDSYLAPSCDVHGWAHAVRTHLPQNSCLLLFCLLCALHVLKC
jgi:hypothetical protein